MAETFTGADGNHPQGHSRRCELPSAPVKASAILAYEEGFASAACVAANQLHHK